MDETIFLYNQDAEAAVLGAILYEPDLIKDCILQPDQLTPGRHYNIFYTMRDMDAKGTPIDLVTIVERVGKKIDQLGGVDYLSKLAGAVATTANFQQHCHIIVEYYQRRQAVEIAERIKKAANEGSALEAIQYGVSDLMAVEDAGTDDDDGNIKEALVDMYDDLESATGEITGIPTGFKELDVMTGGYKGGQLIIVGARPSMGKTAYAINKSINAEKNGDVVGLFSLEMAKKELLKRASASIGGINAQKMKSAGKNFGDDDWNRLMQAMAQLSSSNIRIFDRAGIDVNYIWSKTRKLKRQFDGKRIMIIIDYLQLIVGNKKHNGNRQAEIAEISRTLKHMARELDIVVVALSQLSRGVETRQDKRPMMSDLRESGQIEQDADVIQFLYRDDYYNSESEKKDIVEIIISKHRDGPIGNVELLFVKECSQFLNLDRRL